MKIIYGAIAFGFGLIANQSFAQSGSLAYGSQSVLSTYSSNPAMGVSNVKWVLGLPTNFHLDVNNSFTLSDLLEKSGTKTVANLTRFAGNLQAQNRFSMAMSSELGHFGYRLDKYNLYLCAGAQLFSNTQANFSNTALKLLFQGNLVNPNETLNQESFYTQTFVATYIGATKVFNNQWSVGVRLKKLNGIGHIETQKLNYTVQTDLNSNPAYALKIKSDMAMQASGVFGTVLGAVGNTAKWRTLNADLKTNLLAGSGVGLDLGILYKINGNLRVSASVINIGSLAWTEANAVTGKTDGAGTFDWSGYTYRIGGENATFRSDSITRAIKKTFWPVFASAAYSTRLPSVFYLGASYQLTRKQQVSAVFSSQTIGSESNTLLGLNYRIQLHDNLQLLSGVSIPNHSAMSFGGGLIWSPGPVQMYFMTDNITGLAIDNAHRIQFQLGFHIFQRKKVAVGNKSVK
jgi:hypothetical protein